MNTAKPIEFHPLAAQTARYQDLPVQALKVTAHLRPGQRIGGDGPIQFDNLLARCVVDHVTMGEGLPDTSDAYLLPTPLARLWSDENGFPLWASTCLLPVDPLTDCWYIHKRARPGRYTKTNSGRDIIYAQKGRDKERRVPVQTTISETLVAHCIGNAEEIERLLSDKVFLGKHRSRGLGEVVKWTIEPINMPRLAPAILVVDGTLCRPVPLEAATPLGIVTGRQEIILAGWTPPQWKPSLFCPCIPIGSRALISEPAAALPSDKIDYFSGDI